MSQTRPPARPVLDSVPTPSPLSWVYTVLAKGLEPPGHPLPSLSEAASPLSGLENLQPLPVHAATITPGSPPQPRAQFPFASSAQVPGCPSGCGLTTQLLSLHPWLPTAHKVEKDLDADPASRGLHSPVSANSSTPNSLPLFLRTSEFQGVPSCPIYKVHRKKGENDLPMLGTVLVCLHTRSY